MADAGVSRMYARYRAHKLTIEQAIDQLGANSNGWQWVVLSHKALK